MSGNLNMPLRVMLSTTLQTALAGMHGVGALSRFVAPMALAVGGDLLLPAPPCPRLIGFDLQAPVGHRLWLHARRGLSPRAPGVPMRPVRRHPVGANVGER